jgi:hypothetical protein
VERRERERLRVDPDAGGLERRRVPVVGQSARVGAHDGELGAAAADLGELLLPSRRRGDPVLEARQARDVERRQMILGVEDEGQRDPGDENTRDDPDLVSTRADAIRGPAAAERDRQHRHPRAGGVGECRRDRRAAEVLVRRRGRDGTEERARTRDEDEAERHAEQDAPAGVRRPKAREGRQAPLDQQTDLRHQENGCHHEQERDCEIAEQVVRQAELAEDPGREQREEAEAEHEPGDDPERLSARCTAREQDGQDRQHARRERRRDACEEPECDQEQHWCYRPVCPSRRYAASSAGAAFSSAAVSPAGFRRRRRRRFGGGSSPSAGAAGASAACCAVSVV